MTEEKCVWQKNEEANKTESRSESFLGSWLEEETHKMNVSVHGHTVTTLPGPQDSLWMSLFSYTWPIPPLEHSWGASGKHWDCYPIAAATELRLTRMGCPWDPSSCHIPKKTELTLKLKFKASQKQNHKMELKLWESRKLQQVVGVTGRDGRPNTLACRIPGLTTTAQKGRTTTLLLRFSALKGILYTSRAGPKASNLN